MGTLLTEEQVKKRNTKILSGWTHIWFQNAAKLWAGKILGKKHDIKKLAGKHSGIPALITGSGPSLEESLSTLKGNFPGITITTNSALSACLKSGLKPDYVHIFDGLYKKDRMEGIPIDGIPLIGCTTLDPDLVKWWKKRAPVHAFHMFDPQSEYFKEFQWYFWDYDAFYTSGSVAPNAIRIAAYLGCDPIILVGLDLGFTGGKYRVGQYKMVDGEWKEKDFDHEKQINGNPLVFEKGCPSWKITGILYKTAVVGISNEIKKQGLTFLRLMYTDDKKNKGGVSTCTFTETKGVRVLNATTGGIWDDEIERVELGEWLSGLKEVA